MLTSCVPKDGLQIRVSGALGSPAASKHIFRGPREAPGASPTACQESHPVAGEKASVRVTPVESFTLQQKLSGFWVFFEPFLKVIVTITKWLPGSGFENSSVGAFLFALFRVSV